MCVCGGGWKGEFLFTAAYIGLPVVPTQPLNMDLCLRTGGTGSALIRRDECVCLESASKGDSGPPPLPSPLPRTASASSLPEQASSDSRPRSPLYLIRTEVPSTLGKDLISIFPLLNWDPPVPPHQGPSMAAWPSPSPLTGVKACPREQPGGTKGWGLGVGCCSCEEKPTLHPTPTAPCSSALSSRALEPVAKHLWTAWEQQGAP